MCSLGRQCLPEDEVYAHDALWLGVAAVINNRSLGFYPDEASVLRQHTILTAHCLTLGAHCRERERGGKELCVRLQHEAESYTRTVNIL